MTDFVNVQIDRDKFVVAPLLNQLVEKIVLTTPDIVFKPDVKNGKVTGFLLPKDGGHTVLGRLTAYRNGDEVGSIAVDKRWTNRNGYEDVYRLTSWRINKSRGDRNSLVTNKADVAAREAKKVFLPRTSREAYDAILIQARYDFGRAMTDMRAPIVSEHHIQRSSIAVQLYTYYTVNGFAMPPEVKDIENTVRTEAYHKSVAKYLLAEKQMNAKHIWLIVPAHDVFMYEDDSGLHEKTFDDLPLDWQNKMAVLQFAKNNEAVDDAGYRNTDQAFRIVL